MNETGLTSMMLSIRTDKPEAEVGLHAHGDQLGYHTWQAHRQLAETIHLKIRAVLSEHGKQLKDISGIVVYEGPGSFTGLRIGMSVANALAYSLGIPIVASSGDSWIQEGIRQLTGKKSSAEWVTPAYGGTANTTQPRK